MVFKCKYVCVLALLVASATLSGGVTTYTIEWTKEGVRQYSANSPLEVILGDEVHLNCTQNNETRVVTLLIDRLQYDNCNCVAGTESSCATSQELATQCLPSPWPRVVIRIMKNSLMLPSVFDYIPGQTYFMTSFLPGETSGGSCLDSADGNKGLKMAMTVLTDVGTTTTGATTNIPTTDAPGVPSTQPSPDTGPGVMVSTATSVSSPGTVIPVRLSEANTTAPVALIAGVTSGALLFTVVVLLLCAAFIYWVHRASKTSTLKESQEMEEASLNEVANTKPGPGAPDFQQDNRRSNDYQLLNIKVHNNHSLQTAATAEGRRSMESRDQDFKQDLSLSQSFQRYEVMDAVLRNSQSSLLTAPVTSEGSMEPEGEKKTEEGEGATADEDLNDKVGESSVPASLIANLSPNDRTMAEDPSHPRNPPENVRLISIDENSIALETPKHVPMIPSPHKEPLSSQSSVASFTGFALSRVNNNNTDDQDITAKDDSVFSEMDGGNNDQDDGNNEQDDSTKPPKPSPAPRKMRGSTEDLLSDTAEGVTQENGVHAVRGECSSPTAPGPVKPKPKPKPRAVKKLEELNETGHEVVPKV